MCKPYRFFALHKTTKECRYFNSIMSKPYQYHNVTDEAYEWDIYEDLRYKAKLRLYNYITFIKQGLSIPQYNPYKGTEIGKTIPILNF